MEELLKIENLSVGIATGAGKVQAVRDVSFTLQPHYSRKICLSGQFVIYLLIFGEKCLLVVFEEDGINLENIVDTSS